MDEKQKLQVIIHFTHGKNLCDKKFFLVVYTHYAYSVLLNMNMSWKFRVGSTNIQIRWEKARLRLN